MGICLLLLNMAFVVKKKKEREPPVCIYFGKTGHCLERFLFTLVTFLFELAFFEITSALLLMKTKQTFFFNDVMKAFTGSFI